MYNGKAIMFDHLTGSSYGEHKQQPDPVRNRVHTFPGGQQFSIVSFMSRRVSTAKLPSGATGEDDLLESGGDLRAVVCYADLFGGVWPVCIILLLLGIFRGSRL